MLQLKIWCFFLIILKIIKIIKKLINFKLTINFELIRKFLSFGYRTVFNKNHTFFNEIKSRNQSSCREINHNNNESKDRKYWTAKSSKIKGAQIQKIKIFSQIRYILFLTLFKGGPEFYAHDLENRGPSILKA